MNLYLSTVWSFVSFLMQPEDSFMGSLGDDAGCPGTKRNFTGTVKAVFWIVIAVAAGLMISKL